MKRIIITALAVAIASFRSFAAASPSDRILVETEDFDCRGGWVIDHEAFGKIHSAYIMAHGLGHPVADATTLFKAEKPGRYHVWVSTYNWTSPWYSGKGAGAFEMLVNGVKTGEDLGTVGDKWMWQYAGEADLKALNTLVIRDLTGFNGRVDAVCFTKTRQAPDFKSVRNETLCRRYEGYDLVVAGGGIAGCATALTAARFGLKVALINNVPWLGGNIMYGAHACGVMCYNLYPEIGNVTCQMVGARPSEKHRRDYYTIGKNGCGYIDTDAPIPSWEDVEGRIEDTPFIRAWNGLTRSEKSHQTKDETAYIDLEKERLRISFVRDSLLRQAGVDIFPSYHIFEVERKADGDIASVRARSTKGEDDIIVSGALFSDCTGDGDVAYLAGARYMIGREGKEFAGERLAPDTPDKKMMGTTIYWRAFPRTSRLDFPSLKDMPWAAQCDSSYFIDTHHSRWWWETGLEIDNALEPELVRDNYLRAVFGNWSYLKEHVEKYRDYRLDYLNYIAAKRESRRIVGEIVLSSKDIKDKVEYPDASFTTTWGMDLHYAMEDNARRFPGWEWQTYCTNSDPDFCVHHYHVPYRVLCCKDIDNLFLGGRSISVTHLALGTVRVQSTLGMAGEVTAMAARICRNHGAKPKDVYYKYLDELKEMMKAGSPLRTLAEKPAMKVLVLGDDFSKDITEGQINAIAGADGRSFEFTTVPFSDSAAKNVLKSSSWDAVILQESQKDAVLGDNDAFVEKVCATVRKYAPKGTEIYWNQMWATEEFATVDYADRYGYDSFRMYDALSARSRRICGKYGFRILPTGTAIQNVRKSVYKKNVNSDGCRLNRRLGTYAASCCWYEALTGKSTAGNTAPGFHLTAEMRDVCRKAADYAIEKPYSVTSFIDDWRTYNEADVPSYELPDPLVCEDGTRVTTAEEWMNRRRPELFSLFESEEYGKVPGKPEGLHFKEVRRNGNFLNGKALMKEVRIFFTADEKKYMTLLVITPKGLGKPAPMFAGINFRGNHTIWSDPSISKPDSAGLAEYAVVEQLQRGERSGRWPVDMLIGAGYGLATFFLGDLDPDFDDGHLNGVHPLFYKDGRDYTAPDEWGSIGAWSWGLSRAMDYLETDPDADASKVAVIGHSRLSKTALWTAVRDTRFAMAIPNNPGCSGGAISRRKFGETVERINRHFPHWFCANYQKYNGKEENLPFDQHELIALMAPRPVYIASATMDLHGDPYGEFLGAKAASPVYELFGLKGLVADDVPPVHTPMMDGSIAYHIRSGLHNITYYDWAQYIKFADRYFKNK